MKVESAVRACAILTDEEGLICAATPEVLQLFGWSAAELTGRSISMLIPAAASIKSLADSGATNDLSVQGVGRGGRSFVASVRVRVIGLDKKCVRLWFVMDQDEATRVESTLRRLEQELEATQRLAHAGHWYRDLRTEHSEWSDSVYRILGLAPRSLRATRGLFFSFVHPDDRARIQEATNRGIREQIGFELECRVVRADQSERVVRLAERVILDRAGEAVQVVGTIQDITAKRESDRTISMLTSAVEQTADQVMIVDRHGKIEYVNPAFEESTGYTREEILGTNPRILKSGHHEASFYEHLWREILAGNTFRAVIINKRKSGEIYHEEKTISPIRDVHGTITHFLSTGRDITERRIAEEKEADLLDALHASARKWRLTFDAMDTPIVITDRFGVIQRLNTAAQRLSGRSFTELVGMPLPEISGRQPWTALHEMLALPFKQELSREIEGDDGRFWEVSRHGYVDEDTYILFVARDVTGVRHLQDTLRRNEMMSVLGRLVAGVAHEVRNPLFGMSATIDAFDGQSLDSRTASEFTRRLRTELGRLSELMHDLLQYGRPQEPVRQVGDLRDAILEAVQLVEPLTKERAVLLELNLGDEPVVVLMDSPRMQQIFRNLLENSIQHSPRGECVNVELRLSRSHVECSVLDRGPGFRAEDIPFVFEPFFTKRRGGTGLGLSIVKRLIEQHDGEVVVTNRDGGGGEVCVRFSVEDPTHGSPEAAGAGMEAN